MLGSFFEKVKLKTDVNPEIVSCFCGEYVVRIDYGFTLCLRFLQIDRKQSFPTIPERTGAESQHFILAPKDLFATYQIEDEITIVQKTTTDNSVKLDNVVSGEEILYFQHLINMISHYYYLSNLFVYNSQL